MASIQSSQLLPSLFTQQDPEQRLTVLHIGAALPETVAFFSRFRCKLFFVDVFGELPFTLDAEDGISLEQQFVQLMAIPAGTRIDICLFWDVFNYLDSRTIAALMAAVRPSLHPDTLAHGFAIHKLNSTQSSRAYGIQDSDVISVRLRVPPLAGYMPHPQSALRDMLNCFVFDRSVLLSDSRLEILLKMNPAGGSIKN
jgi:hypothetical protein